jgi:hypothetical protein
MKLRPKDVMCGDVDRLQINYASLVCLRLGFIIFASFEMVGFGFLWDLRVPPGYSYLGSDVSNLVRTFGRGLSEAVWATPGMPGDRSKL